MVIDSFRAEVVELVDTQASGACTRKGVLVQVQSSVPIKEIKVLRIFRKAFFLALFGWRWIKFKCIGNRQREVHFASLLMLFSKVVWIWFLGYESIYLAEKVYNGKIMQTRSARRYR